MPYGARPRRGARCWWDRRPSDDVGMVADWASSRDLVGRYHEIDAAGVHRAPWYAQKVAESSWAKVMPPAALISEPDGAVRAVAGEDHPDGGGRALFGEGLEEVIDREMLTPEIASRGQVKAVLGERHDRIRRDDVDVIGLHRGAVGDLADRHARGLCQQVGEAALVLGIEMLDQHEGHPAVGREISQELCEGFEPTGGRADSDDRERA